MHRFVVAPEILDQSTVTLTGAEAHHLQRVLRLRPGEMIEVLDGQGRIGLVELTRVDRGTAVGRLLSLRRENARTPCPLILAQALIREQKMDLVVQKSTELGVSTLVPLITRYSRDPHRAERRLDRWQRIMAEACKQSGRATPMHIASPVSLNQLHLDGVRYRFLCRPRLSGQVPGPEVFGGPGSVLVMVGPEGGFHACEEQWAREKGFVSLTLAGQVLRAETAAIGAVAILSYLVRLARVPALVEP